MSDAQRGEGGSREPVREPVVVTGLGAVSAWGWGTEALWRGLVGGTTGVGRPRRFDTAGQRTQVAAEVPDPPPELARLPHWRRLSQAERFALAATFEACRAAAIAVPFADDDAAAERCGLYFGGSTAGMAETETFFDDLRAAARDPRAPPPKRLWRIAAQPINTPGDAAARACRLRGPVETVSSACAAGGLAIGAALEALRRGEVDVALAGGSDALCLLTYSGFNSLRAVSPEACNPFRADRAGLSLGEGAGILVLERRSRALGRGAAPLAEIAGAGASCDAYHMTAPHPEGKGAALAIARALADAGIAAGEVAFVNAHGTGTPHNDVAEWRAVAGVFGERAARLPLTSTKGSVGHFLGSSGAVEAVATVLSLIHGEVHPTPGGGALDPEIAADLVVGRPRPVDRAGVAVSTSLAFGGANAALVVRGLAAARAAGAAA